MRLILAVVAISTAVVPRALAQSEDWLVLPTTTNGDTGWMVPTVGRINRELRKQGIGVWSSQRAVTTFEERGSAPPAALSSQMVEEWGTLSKAVVLPLASGDYERASSQLRDLQVLSDAALEQLSRDPKRAQVVLDNCLYMVRVLLSTGDLAEAQARAQRCVALVPLTTPTPRMHPPSVTALYSQAAAFGPERAGVLFVESEPSQCPVRVNGVLVGETPFEMTDLYPGEYRAQVECEPGTPGRVHRVEVSRGRNNLFVVDRFDRALRTAPVLYLGYDTQASATQRARDAREFVRVLPAGGVVLASVSASDELELRLYRGTQEPAALARVAITESGPNAQQTIVAVATLLAGECKDLTGDEALNLDCATGEVRTLEAEAPRAGRPPRGQFISGLALASVGTASILTGYGLLIGRVSTGNDWVANPNSLDAYSKWLNLGLPIVVTGATGGATLVTAMPLALPYRNKTPWWAWVSGGLGVGFAAGAIASGVTANAEPAEGCGTNALTNSQPCVDRATRTDLAIMLGATAAPLLTMPLVYLFRKDDKRLEAELSPSIQVDRRGASLHVYGRF